MSDNLNQNSSVQFVPHPQIEDHTVEGYKYYSSYVANFAMIRHDGKRIVFREHFFETDQSGDIDYLDEEIKNKNIYIRPATHEEIRANHLRKNPTKVIMEDVKSDEEFMNQLRKEVEAKLKGEGWAPPVDNSEVKLAGAGIGGPVNTVVDIGNAKVELSPLERLDRLKPVSTADLSKNSTDSNSK